MKSEFELRSLDMQLQRLLDESILKDSTQKKKLYELYSKDSRNYMEIHEEIKKLRYNPEFLSEKLKQNEMILGKEANTIDTKKKVEYPLSLENITDFQKNGKSFIKIHYPAPSDRVRIIENMTNPYKSGKEIFEGLKDSQKTMSLDGDANVTAIFEQVLLRDCNEIKLRDAKEVSSAGEFSKLSAKEREVVFGTLKTVVSSLDVSEEIKKRLSSENLEVMFQLISKKIYISPEKNIIISTVPNLPEKDRVSELKITIEQGVKRYSLSPLDGKGFKYDSQYPYRKLDVKDSDKPMENKTIGNDDSDIDKTKGKAYVPTPPWKKKKNNQAAFISILWIAMFAGILVGIISFVITTMFLSK